MEPEPPKVDRAVLDFVHGNIFGRADSVIRTDGVCRLSSQLARMVMARCRNRKSTAGRPEST
jgi:CRISPR-associated protein Cas1